MTAPAHLFLSATKVKEFNLTNPNTVAILNKLLIKHNEAGYRSE